MRHLRRRARMMRPRAAFNGEGGSLADTVAVALELQDEHPAGRSREVQAESVARDGVVGVVLRANERREDACGVLLGKSPALVDELDLPVATDAAGLPRRADRDRGLALAELPRVVDEVV